MADLRHQKLAKVLVHYSLKLQPGDKLLITAHDLAAPLVKEVYREAIRAGAHISTKISLDGLSEIKYLEGNEEQLTYISEVAKLEVEEIDAELTIWSKPNSKDLKGIDPAKIALAHKASGVLFKRFLERQGSGNMRWCGTLFPTNGYAQDAEMSLSRYEDFVYGAGLLDLDDPVAAWQQVQAEQQRVADFLNQRDVIRIVAPGTDITYRVGGRKWINCAGTANFPDGEVFTGPHEDSVNGSVRFSYPAVYNGNSVEDVHLTFKDGKVIKATAGRGKEFLDAMLDMDNGSRTLGEAAFGLNYNIKEFTGETLFDEKIGGTMHMALGQSIPESGGVNESALHWDMVCDLREGKVYADGQLCYEHGKFIF
ncbi:MAG TPA: aminopeptidase [Ktedonobacteraceae bacterium]|nr:aminopeptidase [Ktedonobacteraceae bacterium]